MKKTLIVLLGPTAIGKTNLSLSLARHLNTSIISCDSRQIYKETTIGTAVPDQNTLKSVPHFFIHSHSIHDYYNASKFEIEVLDKLEELYHLNDVVVMTGGSMMYIDAVCNGIDDLPEVDPEIRQTLIRRMDEEGIESLRNELRVLDPDYYKQVDLQNPKRILHALEMYFMTGKPYSQLRTNTTKERPFQIIKIGLNRDRAELYDRINARVDEMIATGLIEEARRLYPYRNLNSMNTVGYRELFDYFDSTLSLEEACEKIKANTRKYARKQLTWFRRDKTIQWFHPDDERTVIQYIDAKLL